MKSIRTGADLLQGTWDTILGATHRRQPSLLHSKQQAITLFAGRDHTGVSDEPVKLLGYYNSTPAKTRGLAVLLHGWEGHAQSADMIHLAESLNDSGFDCFRLNLRDHGDSAHLNPGLFNATLINEVVIALENLVSRFKPEHLFLIGNSLGGNFALRIGIHGSAQLPQLRRIVAVCPPLNPKKSTERIDSHLIFRRYFRRHWNRSLNTKQKHFPHLYNFAQIKRESSIMSMVAWLQGRHTPFSSMQDYFFGYSVPHDHLQRLPCPTLIIAARNDPVIPVEDFLAIKAQPQLRIHLLERGGHLGFVRPWPYTRTTIPSLVLGALLECN